MNNHSRIVFHTIFALVCIWIMGCGGCNPEPVPSGMSPTEGPETGNTTVTITGEKFDVKNGVTVTFGGKEGSNVTVTEATELTVLTPAGTAGESVDVVITNKGKPDVPVSLSQQFTYTDATPPTVISTDPEDGTVFSEYEDSLNVLDTLSVSFSEAVDVDTVSIDVSVAKTEDSLSEPAEPTVSGTVSGSGDTVTFTADVPMRCGRMYTVTVSGAADMAKNVLENAYSFSFSVTSPEQLDSYRIREEDLKDGNGKVALMRIASRPEIYDNEELWERLITGNHDVEDYIFDRTNLKVNQHLWIKRGRAWGDE